MTSSRPFLRSLTLTRAAEGDQVTTLELFFDLVYVFALTQVTTLVVHGSPPSSLVEGFVVLSLLWWSWCSYAWLANQARADAGIVRGGFVLAMVAVFVACLALPDAFHDVAADGPGRIGGAAVLVVCYAVVRLTHTGVYLVAARGEPRLRRQILLTALAAFVPTIALLGVGAAARPPAPQGLGLPPGREAIPAGAHSVGGGGPPPPPTAEGWEIRSAAHFSERHSLMVILALGESVVAVAVGLGGRPFSAAVAAGAVLSVLIAVGLWSTYFDRLLDGLEGSLDAVQGRSRARLGRDLFTYLHFPIILGIIVTATGVETAMAHLDEDHLGALAGWTLGAGVALFLAGTVAAAVRARLDRPTPRIVAIVLLLAGSPLLALAPPLLAVGAVAVLVLALTAVESATP